MEVLTSEGKARPGGDGGAWCDHQTDYRHDLDTPTAVAAVDALAARGSAPAEGDLAAIHALLGIRL
jgi:hypothetical protein